jgi:hypothetical protein
MHEYRKFQSKGEMIESHQVIRKILRDKEEKATFIMIADQNALGDNNLVVNFLTSQRRCCKALSLWLLKWQWLLSILELTEFPEENILYIFQQLRKMAQRKSMDLLQKNMLNFWRAISKKIKSIGCGVTDAGRKTFLFCVASKLILK